MPHQRIGALHMLYHPGQQELLMDVREDELARRARRLALQGPGPGRHSPVRHAAATLLRRAADRLDPHRGIGASGLSAAH